MDVPYSGNVAQPVVAQPVVAQSRAKNAWDTACAKVFSKAAFFWLVNVVFMGVSVLHSGLFFALLEPSDKKLFWGMAPLLGFAVALVLDLASIVFMQARLAALRMNEKRSAGWYLFSIIVCSGLSAFGNLAMSRQDFQASSLNNAGDIIQGISPWLGVAFPLLIILISIAADKVLDIDPIHNMDVAAYRTQEIKRIGILKARNEFLKQQVEEEQKGKLLKLEMRGKAPKAKNESESKQPRVFRWPWERMPSFGPSETEMQTLTETIQGLQQDLQNVRNETNIALLDAVQRLTELQQQSSEQMRQTFVHELDGRMRQLEGNTEYRLTELQQHIKRVAERTTISATPASRQFRSTRLVPKPKEGAKVAPNSEFDKKKFVIDCLTEHPEWGGADIQRKATEIGQSVSAGYISDIRKALAGTDERITDEHLALSTLSLVTAAQ